MNDSPSNTKTLSDHGILPAFNRFQNQRLKNRNISDPITNGTEIVDGLSHDRYK
jgi:hypothetical protein